MSIPFTKMQGIGNDFVVIDTLRDSGPLGSLSELAKRVCDRKLGIGADGLILVLKREEKLEMAMLNPDGSLSEMCGNGLRCFGRLAIDRGYASGEFPVITGAGELTVTEQAAEKSISIDMGEATFPLGPNLIDLGEGFHAVHVSMGNPHIVLFTENVDAIPLEEVGPQLEHHPLFPNRTNVHFVQVIGPGEIKQRTWERGAGITLACGTGACACAVASFTMGKTEREVLNHLPGGDLKLEYAESGHVIMTGPAEYVFEGQLP